MKSKLLPLLALLALSLLVAPAGWGAPPLWRFAYGMHDMVVPDAGNSHTYGVDALFSVEGTLPNGGHWIASEEILLDFDKDELDPDHIPVWWRMHLGADSPIMQPAGAWTFSWVGDFDTKVNTVSCIEREIRGMAGLAGGCRYGGFRADLKAAAGWFFLEIDDDVPKERGYGRDDFRQSVFAGTLEAKASLDLGRSCRLGGRAQIWSDQHNWLERQYRAELRFAMDRWQPDSALVLSFEYTEYNLDPYIPAGTPPPYLPILPWSDDRLIQLSFNQRW